MEFQRLRTFDLNLLVIFDTIMLERSIARASERLSLSESAVSHALARLRKRLDDPLFTREGSSLRPSTRARQLAVPVRRALQRIEGAINFAPFDPSQDARTFLLAGCDYTCTLIVPRLIASLHRDAPLIDLSVVPAGRTDVIRQLDDGTLDFAIGWFATVPERFRRMKLFEESYALVVRKDHPLTRAKLTAARVFGFPHVVVDYTGSSDGMMDGFLPERGVLRRVLFQGALDETPQRLRFRGRTALTVPGFTDAAHSLSTSNMVASMPRRLALKICAEQKLVALEPPFDSPVATVELLWHRRFDADVGLRWFRDRIAAAAEEMAGMETPLRRRTATLRRLK
jgi:DNA-binding transcriptional LysR family regulator